MSDTEIRKVQLLSIAAWVLSTPVLGMGIWLATKPHAGLNFLQWPLILIGSALFLLPFLGCYMLYREADRRRTCWPFRRRDQNPWKWGFYIFLVTNLLSLLLGFTAFTSAVIRGGGGDAVPDTTFLEFHLPNYSPWLQGRVNTTSTWDKIKHTLIRSKLCHSLPQLYTTLHAFNLAKLSPVESGCCKPPTSCGFLFKTPIDWTYVHTKNTNFEDYSDCVLWSNKKSELCFGCNSCKAGILQNVKVDWNKVSIVNICMLLLLIGVNVVGYFIS